MCGLAAGIGLVSSLIGAVGSIKQASAQSAAAKYNAKVADMNAKISATRARDAQERGAIEEQQKRREIAAFKGRQQAQLAASGVDLNFGSPLDILVDTAVLGEMDAFTVRSNAAREAYGHKVDEVNKTSSAELSRMEAKSAMTGGYLSAAGTLLSGVGDAWKSYRTSQIGAYA